MWTNFLIFFKQIGMETLHNLQYKAYKRQEDLKRFEEKIAFGLHEPSAQISYTIETLKLIESSNKKVKETHSSD